MVGAKFPLKSNREFFGASREILGVETGNLRTEIQTGFDHLVLRRLCLVAKGRSVKRLWPITTVVATSDPLGPTRSASMRVPAPVPQATSRAHLLERSSTTQNWPKGLIWLERDILHKLRLVSSPLPFDGSELAAPFR
jgi:hypothetical protein